MSILKYKNENGIWKKLYSKEEINNLDNITYTSESGKVWCDTTAPQLQARVVVNALEGCTVTASKGTLNIPCNWTPIQVPNPDYIELPEGYTQLSYIQSSGTQWINSGVNQSQGINKLRFVVDCSISTSSAQWRVNGIDGGSGLCVGLNNSTSHTLYYGVGTGNISLNVNYTLNHRILCDNDALNKKVIIFDKTTNTQLASVTTSPSSSSNSINLSYFAYATSSSGANSPWSGNLYSSQIYINNEIQRNFVPCKNPSNVVGLYDLVSNTFFGNNGTGDFIAGETVSPMITSYRYIGNLNEAGKYTITATKDGIENSKSVFVSKSRDYPLSFENYLFKTYLYNKGDTCDTLTGGWGICWHRNDYKNGFVNWNTDNVSLGETNTSNYGNPGIFTKNFIDLTKYSTLHVLTDITNIANYNTNYSSFGIMVTKNMQTEGGTESTDSYVSGGLTLSTTEDRHNLDLTVDVSDVTTGCIYIRPYSHTYAPMTVVGTIHEI